MIRLAFVLLALALCSGSELAAEPLVNQEQHFQIEVPPDLVPEPGGTALHRFASSSGMRASISRIGFPNLQAYWRGERDSFFASLERGAASASSEYRLRRKKDQREGGTPVYDLFFERTRADKRELVWMRVLLFRRFAIIATVTSPAKASHKTRKAAQAVATSLVPWSSADE